MLCFVFFFFFFQAEDGIRDTSVTGVQTCALPISTLGIWFASSLPVYMYFNPSRSHAHSAFAVSLFLWYWHRTRGERTLGQWMLLGGLSGVMVNVYYPNALLLVILGSEALTAYGQTWRREQDPAAVRRLLGEHALYAAATAVARSEERRVGKGVRATVGWA